MKAWRIAAVAVSLAAVLGLPPTASAQDELRVASVSRPAAGAAEVLVSVPRVLSGRTLAPSAFTVTVDGKPVTATATREAGSGFDIALVIETSSSATEDLFLATKAAAVEFLLEQPIDTRVELFSSDPPQLTLGFTADRAATVGAIKSLSRAPGSGLATGVELAARSIGTSHPVTIIAAATAADATVPGSALSDDAATSLRTGPSQLFAAGAVSAPLSQLAADTGGFGRTATVAQLVGAFDSVSADIAGRYRLTFPLAADATRVDVRVTAPEATVAASIPLSSAKSAGTAASSPRGADNGIGAARSAGAPGDSHSRAIAFVVGLLAAGLLTALVVSWSRRRPQPSPAHASAVPEPASAPPQPPPPPLTLPPPPSLPPPPILPPPPVLPPPPPLPPPLPTLDLRRPAPPVPPPLPEPSPLVGYALTAFCDDLEVAELRAAVEPCGIVVSQAHTIDEALRDVVTGRARAIYVDGAISHARELAAAVRQRNDAGWSSCPTLVHDSRRGPPDPALIAVADAYIPTPIDAPHVVAALATRTRGVETPET